MTKPLDNDGILVLGMHRSGTSAIAGVLSKLGVDFGDSLLPGIAGVNDKGFFEHTDVIDLNEDLLAHMERTWLDLDPMPADWWQSGYPAISVTDLQRYLFGISVGSSPGD